MSHTKKPQIIFLASHTSPVNVYPGGGAFEVDHIVSRGKGGGSVDTKREDKILTANYGGS